MKRFDTRRAFLHVNWMPLARLTVCVWIWSTVVHWAVYRSLGGFLGCAEGTVFSLIELAIHSLVAAVVVMPGMLLFGVACCIFARSIRWWLIVAALALVGTPAAFLASRSITRHEIDAHPEAMGWGTLSTFGVGFLIACAIAVIADTRIDYVARTKGGRRLVPFLPSFGVAYGIFLAAVLTFLLWGTLDASFQHMLWFVGSGFPHIVGIAYAWDELAARIAGLLFLGSMVMVAVAALVVRQFVGRATERSTLARILLLATVAGCFALLTASGEFERMGQYVRLKRDLDGFRNAAVKLLGRWPTDHGLLPEVGEYWVYPSKFPDTLMFHGVSSRGCPARETIGYFVNKTADGGIRFSLYRQDYDWVEFHPCGHAPQSFVLTPADMVLKLQTVVRLDNCWYWTRYSVSAAPGNGSAAA